MTAVYLILMLLTLAAIGAGYEERSETYHPRGEGRCRGCGYALAGLPEQARCPECGCDEPGDPVSRSVLGFVPGWMMLRLGGVWLLAVVGQASLWPFVQFAHDWSYRLQLGRFDPVVIANARRARGFDLQWESALLPLGVAVLVCAVLCMLGEGARFWSRALLIAATGWGLSVCWLFVHTNLTFS